LSSASSEIGSIPEMTQVGGIRQERQALYWENADTNLKFC
jgi:hypothetical protein